jgi:peptide/nickel transport system substrate-binding protein
MRIGSELAAALLGAAVAAAPVVASAAETPKSGGTLTYVIPPPSFDGHRETKFATIHSAAPFCCVLIRVDPNNPSSTTDFVCDLCTEMPKPSDVTSTSRTNITAPG